MRVIAVACAALLAGSAVAAEPLSEAERQEGARIHFQAGREYYADGRHERAFSEFVEAYRLFPRPELLFNRALCLEALHHEAAALACYREYLGSAMALDRAEPERRAARLERRVAPASVPRACPDELPRAPVVAAPRPIYKRWWPWTILGVGAAAVVAGVTAGVLVHQHDELPVFPGVR